MKKLSVMLAAMLVLSMLVCSAAFAATTLMPMPTGIDPAHLERASCYARILGYNELENTLTVELIAMEYFDRQALANLQVGDSIHSGGEEVLIEEITPVDWCDMLVFNDGNLFFFGDRDGYYRMSTEDEFFWNSVAVIECPVTEDLLLLDFVDDNSGEGVALPRVLTADELTEKMLAEQASDEYHIGFAIENVYVVFDGEGQLASIHRYYVTWQ